VKRRLEDPEGMANTRWETYYALPKEADGTLSFQGYCAAVQQTADNYAKLVDLLTAYTDAMKALADGETWDGTDLTDLANNLANLAGASTPAGQVLASLAPSAQQVGGFIVAKYTQEKAYEFAKRADTPVQAILDGVSLYLKATIKDVVTPAAKERAEAIGMLEKSSVWTTPTDAARVISFVQYAEATDEDISEINARFTGYEELIAKLKAGQHTLATSSPDKPKVKEILTAATNLLVALNGVRAVLGPKPGN